MYELFTFDPRSTARPSSSRPVATRPPVEPERDVHNPLIRREKPRRSQRSQRSLVASYMALDPIARELFEERAAILEYEAGLARADAERQAFHMVMQRYRPDGP